MTITIDYEVPETQVELGMVRKNRIFVKPSMEDIPSHEHIAPPIENHVSVHLHVIREDGKLFKRADLHHSEVSDDSIVGELLIMCKRQVERLADTYLPRSSLLPLFMIHRCLIDTDGTVCVSFFISKLYGFEYNH